MDKKVIVLFTDGNVVLEVPITPEQDTVWLNRNQMAELFERDVKTIGKHINNALKEELQDQSAIVANFAIVQKEGERTVVRQVAHYNLDVIISGGYRVKSKRGIAFRKWANKVLRDYIVKGYAVNDLQNALSCCSV
ncbi:RhuM family protein [[Clostridium] symbiosum]|uniref:virulence RhuM family protein n=1 Tax=Clostridium symbiosum TaxID=1512 RepID=UPI001D060FDE|nr:RhuM family protein [[Clostridium] symbiosum]MCB6608538.1 virulence RhuM family protein [[Clostridium] symbiosum]MCB6932150.1 virulence RhuM family protein [[Clostridium] symbiosum]